MSPIEFERAYHAWEYTWIDGPNVIEEPKQTNELYEEVEYGT
jgi:hypothetical protein